MRTRVFNEARQPTEQELNAPHNLFTIWRADEVAECLEGVNEELYKALWNNIVSQQKEIPNIEDNGPGDVVGFECLANHWDKLTVEEQKELNALARAQDAKYSGE
jgi:hypothetical protein